MHHTKNVSQVCFWCKRYDSKITCFLRLALNPLRRRLESWGNGSELNQDYPHSKIVALRTAAELRERWTRPRHCEYFYTGPHFSLTGEQWTSHKRFKTPPIGATIAGGFCLRRVNTSRRRSVKDRSNMTQAVNPRVAFWRWNKYKVLFRTKHCFYGTVFPVSISICDYILVSLQVTSARFLGLSCCRETLF